jgi:hypothetical protein
LNGTSRSVSSFAFPGLGSHILQYFDYGDDGHGHQHRNESVLLRPIGCVIPWRGAARYHVQTTPHCQI